MITDMYHNREYRMVRAKPVNGWLTDTLKFTTKAASSAIDLLNQYKAGNLTKEQYEALEKARIESEAAASQKTVLYIGGFALLGILALSVLRNN